MAQWVCRTWMLVSRICKLCAITLFIQKPWPSAHIILKIQTLIYASACIELFSTANCKAELHVSRWRVRKEWNQLFCRYKLGKCEMNFRTNWVEMNIYCVRVHVCLLKRSKYEWFEFVSIITQMRICCGISFRGQIDSYGIFGTRELLPFM